MVAGFKKIIWEGASLKDVSSFSSAARKEAGHQLSKIQMGLDPVDWRSMPSIGPGVKEIRIHQEGEYRVIYVANFFEGVYVLHAFQKKTQKTSARDLDLAKSRLKVVANRRKYHEPHNV